MHIVSHAAGAVVFATERLMRCAKELSSPKHNKARRPIAKPALKYMEETKNGLLLANIMLLSIACFLVSD